MTCPCSVSRFRWIRNLCSLICAAPAALWDALKLAPTTLRQLLAALFVLDQDAGVHYYRQAGGLGLFCGGFVGDAELHPDYFCAGANRGVYNWRDFFGSAEDVDDFNFLRNVFQARVAFFPEHFPFIRIHRTDVVARRLHVFGNALALPRLIRR